MDDKINDIIILLCKGMGGRGRHAADHARPNTLAETIQRLTSDYYAATGAKELHIGVAGGFFVREGVPIFGPSIAGKKLIQFARDLSCGGFTLLSGLTSTELQKFFDITALRTLPVKKLNDARSLFKHYGIQHIGLNDPYVDQAGGVHRDRSQVLVDNSMDEAGQRAALLYQELFDVVSQAHANAATGLRIDINNARAVSEFMLPSIQANFADVMQHVHYPDYDTYIIGHSVRVASLAVYLGSKLGWAGNDLFTLGVAGLLHDIGISRTPVEILLKKGPLTKKELAIIHRHPQVGVEILLAQKGVSDLEVAACWGHHLRHDGGGYPQQPVWAVRHPATALLQICDVYEALTAVRPYKEGLLPQGAYAAMLADRGAFHPWLLASFIAAVGLYPPGAYVRLSDRRIGMVASSGDRIDRPNIKIITSAHGEPLYAEEHYEIALKEGQHQGLRVEKLLLDYLG